MKDTKEEGGKIHTKTSDKNRRNLRANDIDDLRDRAIARRID